MERSHAVSTEMFEAFMLICFGSAWPFAIAKSLSSRSAGGKSPIFLVIILAGYLSGICTHLFGHRSPVMLLYGLNASMVATDLCLALYYRRFPGGKSVWAKQRISRVSSPNAKPARRLATG